MSYDVGCEILARTFLGEETAPAPPSEAEVAELAQRIQDIIEAYLEVRKEPR